MPLEASSSFRRHGQRDDRRRRLLTDDLSQFGRLACLSASGRKMPRRRRSRNIMGMPSSWNGNCGCSTWFRAGWSSLVPLLAAGVGDRRRGWRPPTPGCSAGSASGGAAVAALDLAAKGSLGCWFSSLLLLAASVAAILVYTVRRHRTDDYQGRYRIWLWAAACWFLMATDQAASLREAFRDLMIALTGTPLLGDGSLWWVVVYVLVLGAVGSRLLVDMRSSRLSMAALLVGRASRRPWRWPAGLGWICCRRAAYGRSCSWREPKWPAT